MTPRLERACLPTQDKDHALLVELERLRPECPKGPTRSRRPLLDDRPQCSLCSRSPRPPPSRQSRSLTSR